MASIILSTRLPLNTSYFINSLLVTSSWPTCRVVCSAACTSRPMTVLGSWARPTPRQSGKVAGGVFSNRARMGRRLALSGEVSQLDFAERFAAGVGEGAVEYAREVAQVKAHRRQPQRPLGELFGRKIGHEFSYFFAGLQQGVGHGLEQRRHRGQRAAQPHFGELGSGHG
jgi:hypothetical protein